MKKTVQKQKTHRGTTLVELLLATVFLGLCVGGMLGSISGARTRADIARYDVVALSVAESDIAIARSEAMRGVLAVGTTNASATVSGIPTTVTTTRTVTLVSGTSDIYQITTVVSFTRPVRSRTVTDGVTLSTMVRMPDA